MTKNGKGRLSFNDKILRAIRQNPDEWLSANQISKLINAGNGRIVGKLLSYCYVDLPGLEVKSTNRGYFYRYNQDVKL